MKLLSLLISILLLIFGCTTAKKEEGPKGMAVVERGDVKLEVLATGSVKPKVGAQVNVGTRISGKLERLMVKAGDKVKRGEQIAVVEHEDLQARVDGVQARLKGLRRRKKEDLEEIRKNIAELKAKLSLARLEKKRLATLYLKEYVSKDAVDQVERDVKVLEAQLSAAYNRLTSTEARYSQEIREAKAELREVKVKLSYAFIKAPISGTVSSVTTQQGETVVAGLNAPTFITVIDLSKLQVDAFVDETDIGKVRPEQKATFTVDAFPERTFHAHVFTIYPGAVIRENVVYYDVALDIDDPFEGLLRPEMTANIRIIVGEKKGVLTVPDGAIKMDQSGRSYVMVKEGGKWRKTFMETGWSSGGCTEVVRGLREGQEVAIW